MQNYKFISKNPMKAIENRKNIKKLIIFVDIWKMWDILIDEKSK